MDPRVDGTLEIVKKVIDDLIGLFPTTPIIHLGFDEALHTCWGISKQEALKMENDFFDVLTDYITQKTAPNSLFISHWDDMAADGVYDNPESKSKRIY